MKKLVLGLLVLSAFCGMVFAGGKAEATKASSTGNTAYDNWRRDSKGRVEVVAANTQSLTSLDFMDGADGGMVQCMWDMIYDTLVDDADRLGDYQPRLATSWSHSDDYKTWIFQLREGVTFHNGDTFDAGDVAATMQRIIDNKGKLKRITGVWTYLESYDVLSKYEIRLNFSQSYGTPMKDFAFMPILSEQGYAKLGNKYFTDGHLTGTGKWIFEDFLDGQFIRVRRNDNYWDKSWSTNVDVFTLRFITEASSITSGLLSGEIDAMARIDSDQARLLSADPSLILGKTESSSFIFVGFQCGEDTPSPFKDEKIRKAFSYCIDRQAIADNILGGGEAMAWWFPKPLAGYRDVEPIYDVECAKKLLAESSYKGEEILIYVNTVATAGESIMLAVCDMANAIGFNCRIQMGDQAFLTQVRTSPNYTAYAVTGSGYVDYGNDTYMKWVNTEKNRGYYNQYSDPVFAAKLEEMQATLDPADRDRIQAEVAQMMFDACVPAVPILRYDFNTCIRSGLKGVEFPPSGYYYFNEIYIE